MTSYAVILCGGSGTRLWPLSRSLRPKQLLCLNGDQTLLQQTANRLLRHVSPGHLLTVTHADHKYEVMGQLAELAPDLASAVLAEPQARNTLPAIAWAVSEISKQDPQAIIGVFPSDHAISDEVAFVQAWQAAESAAQSGQFTLIGITPNGPATGYGYIQPGEPMQSDRDDLQVFHVSRFIEKPDLENAKRFVQNGYLWNGGMFVFRADRFQLLLKQHQPEIFDAIGQLDSSNIETTYAQMPNISIDYGLAEKADNIAVVPADMDWSDLGNWDSIYERHNGSGGGNCEQGNVIAHDTSNSLLWSTHGLLATLGVDNLVVVQTADATLICERSRTEDLKQLVSRVKQYYPHLTETHLLVHRPWGSYTVLEEGPNFKIKRIVVAPGARLSMQMHEHRSEHWVVVSGTAQVTNGEKVISLQENESTYIPKQCHHRLENPGSVPLHIIEVQCGDYVGEDDIIRFDDHYGRAVT